MTPTFRQSSVGNGLQGGPPPSLPPMLEVSSVKLLRRTLAGLVLAFSLAARASADSAEAGGLQFSAPFSAAAGTIALGYSSGNHSESYSMFPSHLPDASGGFDGSSLPGVPVPNQEFGFQILPVDPGTPTGWSDRDVPRAIDWARPLPPIRPDVLAGILAGLNQPLPGTTFSAIPAVPEPTVTALLVLGLAGLLALRPRR